MTIFQAQYYGVKPAMLDKQITDRLRSGGDVVELVRSAGWDSR